ncbi:shikimate kinase [Azotosporobacter soli]|uniref:shikimate kinase n=1 Tax=Azotosporobacter soli TaxID=3055040 RepID=UPI0031FED822
MKNIVLIGFMGTGKSTVGRLLARRLGRPFVDSDKKIEMWHGMTIKEMFAQHGEAYFRQCEQEAIARLARYRHAVIATGGGVVLLEENMFRLRQHGVIIALTAELDMILARTSRKDVRPLLNKGEREKTVRELLNGRIERYQQADCVVDTTKLSPPQVVEKIMDFLQQGGYLRGRYNSAPRRP